MTKIAIVSVQLYEFLLSEFNDKIIQNVNE